MRPRLLLGSGGQVGRALMKELGPTAIGWDLPEADLAKPEDLIRKILELKPSAILNAAAYTAVDQAENDPAANQINAVAPGRLADVCRELRIALVHYSTDYVYPGEGDRPWTEQDKTGPLNAYGKSKLEGDRRIEASGCRHLILRTSWVYDGEGRNFLKTMLKLGAEREELTVVNDQHGAPTYAPHLAKATVEALDSAQRTDEFPSGVYHLCSSGETTWHGFAQAIFEKARDAGLPLKVKVVRGVPTREYPTPARRPLNSRLNCNEIAQRLGVQMPHWSEGLTQCFARGVK